MAHKLTVAAVVSRLTTELQAIGFVRVKARSVKLVQRINHETEVFLHPGVSRRGADVRLDPVIGVENLTLRDRLLALDRRRWEGGTRVCHVYLGILDTWGCIYFRTEDELDEVAATVIKSVVEVGLPAMRTYDSLDKVRELLQDQWNPSVNRARVAVLFEKQKLAALQTH